jgi:hypothetical protein
MAAPRSAPLEGAAPHDRMHKLANLHHVLLSLEKMGTIKINRSPPTSRSQSDAHVDSAASEPSSFHEPRMWRPFDVE